MIPAPEAAASAVSSTQELSLQNLFEYAAQQAHSAAQQSPGPAELGSRLLDNFDGFIERNARFDATAQPPDPGDPIASTQESAATDEELLNVGDETQNAQRLGGTDIDHMVDTLGRVFDHAAETQLVSTGATQVSSSVSSLLHGR